MASHQPAGQLVCPAYEALGIPASYVHDLTGTEDANKLLSKPSPVHPSTSKVLLNLRKWNPEDAAGFPEKECGVEGIPFKLVTTSPTWNSADIDGFVAISYVWHNEQWEVPTRFRDAPEDWLLPVCPAMLKAVVASFEDNQLVFSGLINGRSFNRTRYRKLKRLQTWTQFAEMPPVF